MLEGEPTGGPAVAERDQGGDRGQTPVRQHRTGDVQLAGALARRAGVRERLPGAQLREPEPGAGLEQQRRSHRAGGRVALQPGSGQRCLRLVGLVELDQGVHEERQRPDDRGRFRDAQLGLEAQPGVRLGVPDLAVAQPGERPQHAAVRQRDEPPARRRGLDDPVVAGPRRLEVVAEDQAQGRSRAQQGLGLAVEDAVGEQGPEDLQRAPGGPRLDRAPHRGVHPPQPQLGRPRRVGEGVGDGVRGQLQPAVRDHLGLEPGAQGGRGVVRVLEAEPADLEGAVELAEEPESARTAQRDLAATARRGRCLDRGGELLVGVGLHGPGEGQPEVEPDVRQLRRLRGFREGAAQEGGAGQRSASGRRPRRRLLQGPYRRRVARRLAVQQLQADGLGARALGRQHPGGGAVTDAAATGRDAGVQRRRDQRVDQ